MTNRRSYVPADIRPLGEQSLADLHYRLGQAVADGDGKIRANDHVFPANDVPLEGLRLDCVVRRIHPPALRETERVAEIRADFAMTERLMDEAWKRFMQHGSRQRYRAECLKIRTRS